MRTKIFILLILLQLIIVLALLFNILYKNQSVLVSINEISPKTIDFPYSSTFKYYYEPRPNSIQTIDPKLVVELGYPAGTQIRYKINADGLNQIPNYTATKSAGVYRIVTLGDSFTFGQNVNTEDNYPSQLEKKLNSSLKCTNIKKFEVINLGVYGYDIAYSVERYKLRGQKYNPDLILWFIINTDWTRLDELQIPKTASFDAQLQASGEEAKLEKQGIFYKGWEEAQQQILQTLGGERNILRLQKKYLESVNDYYKGPLILFNFPSQDVNSLNIINGFVKDRQHTYFYGNLANIYQNQKYYLGDSHPSSQGYTLIVNDLYNYLTQNNIIPCQK